MKNLSSQSAGNGVGKWMIYLHLIASGLMAAILLVFFVIYSISLPYPDHIYAALAGEGGETVLKTGVEYFHSLSEDRVLIGQVLLIFFAGYIIATISVLCCLRVMLGLSGKCESDGGSLSVKNETGRTENTARPEKGS